MPDPMSEGGARIRLCLGGVTLAGRLAGSVPGRALADRLPLTLTFRDYNGVEKLAPLGAPLPIEGEPSGADPDIGEIGWYAPSGDLVLYYGRVGYWLGIIRLGRYEGDPGIVQAQPDGAQVAIELAD